MDPQILDRWLVYARVEPETFIERRQPGGEPAAANTPHMIPAHRAHAMFARKYGR